MAKNNEMLYRAPWWLRGLRQAFDRLCLGLTLPVGICRSIIRGKNYIPEKTWPSLGRSRGWVPAGVTGHWPFASRTVKGLDTQSDGKLGPNVSLVPYAAVPLRPASPPSVCSGFCRGVEAMVLPVWPHLDWNDECDARLHLSLSG